ncbi:protein kinase family protein [Aspergillus foveolatus]|uniref:protein kinase family protein n=1 Tax=Aspergillus foveolatus TaxID=210207 RepID=UPI003CCD89BB
MAVPACILTRERLCQEARDSENDYFPRSRILSVFTTDDCLSKVYFCDCSVCCGDFRNPDNRRQTFDPKELLDQYATVYALLICLYRPGLIRYFQKHRTPLSGTHFFTVESLHFLNDEGVQLRSIIGDIIHNQYRFHIRAIDRSREPITIHPREVLPIRQNTQQTGQGSFGQVYGFEFAYDEYRGQGLRDITRFARKIFHRDTAGLVEWFNLLHFDRLQHPHLMSALAAFWHEDRFSIVFEEAELTLGAYLNNHGDSLYTHEALWDQVQGLADGLAYLHEGSGSFIAYHGDLKPANILIVKGVMKIADFGLLQVRYRSIANSLEAWSSESDFIASTRRIYGGPDHSNKALMDVWSFAAIISEISVFDLKGIQGLERYRQSRFDDVQEEAPQYKTYIFRHDTELKTSVSRTIDDLQQLVQNSEQQQTGISRFQRRFFNAGFFTLLRQMFSKDYTDCPPSIHVSDELKRMHRQASQPLHDAVPRGNIWDDVSSGAVPNSPRRSNCRLQGKSLLVQCVLYNYNDANIYIIQEPFMRLHQERPSFDPEYTDRSSNRPLPLRATLQQWDGRQYAFEFVDLRDLLILQAAMTKQYAFNCISFPGRRRPALELNGAVVQLWSEKPLQEDQVLWPATLRIANPRMHIAVICRSEKKLLLIKGIWAPHYIDSADLNFQ